MLESTWIFFRISTNIEKYLKKWNIFPKHLYYSCSEFFSGVFFGISIFSTNWVKRFLESTWNFLRIFTSFETYMRKWVISPKYLCTTVTRNSSRQFFANSLVFCSGKIKIQIHSKNFFDVPKFSQNFYRFWEVAEKFESFFELLMFSSVAIFRISQEIQIQRA